MAGCGCLAACSRRMYFASASNTRINDGARVRGRGCAGVSVLQISAMNCDIVAHDRVALPQSEYN